MQTREKESLEDLSKEELVEKIQEFRQETFKYVNKFLEEEEKWAFSNLFLKKLNAVKQKPELAQTICDGFLKLTDSKICICSFFNHDNNQVEIQKTAYKKDYNDKELKKFIEMINTTCTKLLDKSADMNMIINYFYTICKDHLIIVPIVYNRTFLGYLALIKDDNNFYKENIHFVSIFPEHIALILENISLYIESEKANKRKIEFLAGISHEFKTPLNSIIGFSEILKINPDQDKNIRYIENISQSSKHLLTLIEDVLDVSKSQYNRLELNYTRFRPKDEIIKIIYTLEEMLKEKNLSMNYTLADMDLWADKKRFKQLIYNLITNAIKFNKPNGEIVILTYIKEDKFFFEITDTGDGINKRNQEKIFDFFSQVNRSQLKRQLGSGVGLALCKMIVKTHGGDINFKSKLHKGSSFWFSLPLKKETKTE